VTTIPTPLQYLHSFLDLPHDIQAAIEELSKPWPYEEIQIRPGAINRDGTAAQALAFHDWWTGYLPRLNDHIGPNNFKLRLLPWHDDVIAHLRVCNGIIEGWSSGSAKQDKLGPMEAEAQAKKRVVAEKLMLGLYLYYLPTVWMQGEYDRERKLFYPYKGEEQRCAYEMYARCGLLPRRSAGATVPTPACEPSSANGGHAHSTPVMVNGRVQAAAAILRDAEQQAGVRPAPVGATVGVIATERSRRAPHVLATDPQLGLIVGLIHGLLDDTGTAGAAEIDELGRRFGITGLSTLRKKDALRAQATTLSRLDASKLIDGLKALEAPPARAA
jgi:hypothetical protein